MHVRAKARNEHRGGGGTTWLMFCLLSLFPTPGNRLKLHVIHKGDLRARIPYMCL